MHFTSYNHFPEELIIDKEDGEEEDGEIDEIIYTDSPLKRSFNSFDQKNSVYNCAGNESSVNISQKVNESASQNEAGTIFPTPRPPEFVNSIDEPQRPEISKLPIVFQPQATSIKRSPFVSPLYECLFRIFRVLDIQKLIFFFERELPLSGIEYFCLNRQNFLRIDSLRLDDIPLIILKCKEFEKRLDFPLPFSKELMSPPILLLSITENSYYSFPIFPRYQIFQRRGQESLSTYSTNMYHPLKEMAVTGLRPAYSPFSPKPSFFMQSQQPPRWKVLSPELVPKDKGMSPEQNMNSQTYSTGSNNVLSEPTVLEQNSAVAKSNKINSTEDTNDSGNLPNTQAGGIVSRSESKFSFTTLATLIQNRENPVSKWCEHLTTETQIQDFRQLSSRFSLTNRYLLLYFLPTEMQNMENLQSTLTEATRQKNFQLELLEVQASIFNDSSLTSKMVTGHVSFKTQKNAEIAAKNLHIFLKSASNPAFQRSFRFEFTGPRNPNSTLWVGNVQEFVSEKTLQEKFLNLFMYFGPVSRFKLIHERNCAFVEYFNIEQAKLARNYLYGLCFGTAEQYIVLNVDFAANSSGLEKSSTSDCFFCKTTENLALKEYIDLLVPNSFLNTSKKHYENKYQKPFSNNNARLSPSRDYSNKDKWIRPNRNFYNDSSYSTQTSKPYGSSTGEKHICESLDPDTISSSEKWWQKKKTHRRASSQSYDSNKQLKKQRRSQYMDHPIYTGGYKPVKRHRRPLRYAEYRRTMQRRSRSFPENNNNQAQSGCLRKTEHFKEKEQHAKVFYSHKQNEKSPVKQEKSRGETYQNGEKSNRNSNLDLAQKVEIAREDSFILLKSSKEKKNKIFPTVKNKTEQQAQSISTEMIHNENKENTHSISANGASKGQELQENVAENKLSLNNNDRFEDSKPSKCCESLTTSTAETTSESEMIENLQKKSSTFGLNTVNESISNVTCYLQKQGQPICTISLLLEKQGATILNLPLVINIISRTTEDKLCARLEKRPDAFTIWRLVPNCENERDAYCDLWKYFKSRNRVGLLEDSAVVIFIVPTEPETFQSIYRCLFKTPCKEPTIYAFICSKKLCKIQ